MPFIIFAKEWVEYTNEKKNLSINYIHFGFSYTFCRFPYFCLCFRLQFIVTRKQKSLNSIWNSSPSVNEKRKKKTADWSQSSCSIFDAYTRPKSILIIQNLNYNRMTYTNIHQHKPSDRLIQPTKFLFYFLFFFVVCRFYYYYLFSFGFIHLRAQHSQHFQFVCESQIHRNRYETVKIN